MGENIHVTYVFILDEYSPLFSKILHFFIKNLPCSKLFYFIYSYIWKIIYPIYYFCS